MRSQIKPALAIALAAVLLAGCASADKQQTTAKQTSTTAMAGMNMAGGSGTAVPTVNGIKPVAIRTLATSYWQDMEIQAQTMTPVAFVVFTGDGKERTFKPPKGASFHLMVMLTDRHTHFQIPYAGVWATITDSAGKVVYNDQQWPMISEYMGTHYGNNVPHLAPGQLHPEAADQPSGLGPPSRVRARLAEAARGHRTLHLEAGDMSGRGVFTRRRFLTGAGGFVAAAVAAGVVIDQSASGPAVPLAVLPAPVPGLPVRQHAWDAMLIPDRSATRRRPAMTGCCCSTCAGHRPALRATAGGRSCGRLEHAHRWGPTGCCSRPAGHPPTSERVLGVPSPIPRATATVRVRSSRRSTTSTSACTWRPTIRRCLPPASAS